MAYRVDSSRSNDIGREEMHLVAGRPRPATCRTSAVTRVSIPIVKHGRVLEVRWSIRADLGQYPHHRFPPHTHRSDPLDTSPGHPVLRSKMVVGSSAEPPPMIPGFPRVHPPGHMHHWGRVVQRGEGLPGPSPGSHNRRTRNGTSEDKVKTTSF